MPIAIGVQIERELKEPMDNIQTLFQQLSKMQWTDYLDIIAVACLLYWLIPLFRTTGTGRIAKVIVMILVVAWLTEALKLYTLSFLISQLLSIGLIAIVVLFQPEIRRMIDSYTGACEAMSRERVGALIVFARDSRLDEYFKTGTMIEGQVSEQLIRNIFFPKASLHDGAMIIRDGRVAAAGCVLPLSDSNRLSADLGTRHRAGVGVSEATDAVVVIVSEETGTISVAVNGMLKRYLAAQTLERLLRNELCHDSETKEGSPVLRLRQKLHIKEKGGSDIEN